MTNTELAAITKALYAAISGGPGECNWSSFRSLFRPSARLIRVNQSVDGDHHSGRVHIMSVDDYIMDVDNKIRGADFKEKESAHEASSTGDTAQVRSTYEARLKTNAVEQSWHGVNYLQLIYDPFGWRIISIIWDAHSAPQRHYESDIPGNAS